jgi:hypothetical protein
MGSKSVRKDSDYPIFEKMRAHGHRCNTGNGQRKRMDILLAPFALDGFVQRALPFFRGLQIKVECIRNGKLQRL